MLPWRRHGRQAHVQRDDLGHPGGEVRHPTPGRRPLRRLSPGRAHPDARRDPAARPPLPGTTCANEARPGAPAWSTRCSPSWRCSTRAGSPPSPRCPSRVKDVEELTSNPDFVISAGSSNKVVPIISIVEAKKRTTSTPARRSARPGSTPPTCSTRVSLRAALQVRDHRHGLEVALRLDGRDKQVVLDRDLYLINEVPRILGIFRRIVARVAGGPRRAGALVGAGSTWVASDSSGRSGGPRFPAGPDATHLDPQRGVWDPAARSGARGTWSTSPPSGTGRRRAGWRTSRPGSRRWWRR